MKITPYTTKTGIQIGCMYQPRQTWEPSADMERLQLSLLEPTYRPAAEVFWDAVLWTLSVALLAALIVGVHYA
jgi:hypothetical protein